MTAQRQESRPLHPDVRKRRSATASHHVDILRKAGLLSTCRAGKTALRSVTPLGLALLDGRAATWSRRSE